eukprot:3627101-Pyramimonas_sp.AAC.1
MLWGCLRRFGHFLFQHASFSEQIWRMSQAIRSFQHSKGSGGGVYHSAPFAGCCGDVSAGL